MSYWDRVARIYNVFIKKDKTAYKRIDCKLAELIKKDMKVLEIGCGPGTFSKVISLLCEHLTASDYAEGMVREAEKALASLDNVTVKKEDAMNLSFEDESFDLVFVANTLHIIPDAAKALSECARVLKRGGLLTAPNFTHTGAKQNKLIYGILKISGCKEYVQWTEKDYLEFIKNQGWDIIEHELIPSSFPIAYVVAKKPQIQS